LNSLGFNVGPGEESSQSEFIAMINYLGVRSIRGATLNGNQVSWAIPIAQATNTKWLYALDSGPVETPSSLGAEIASARQLANAVFLLAVEGANETDNWTVTWDGVVGGGGNSWMPVAQMQAALYAAVKADSVLKNYPVYTSSHVGGEVDNVGLQFLAIPTGAGTLMPDGTVYADFGNLHDYALPTGATNYADNDAWNITQNYKLDYGHTWYGAGFNGYTGSVLANLPLVATETGWTSDAGGSDI
jgi:hypothetical protein